MLSLFLFPGSYGILTIPIVLGDTVIFSDNDTSVPFMGTTGLVTTIYQVLTHFLFYCSYLISLFSPSR